MKNFQKPVTLFATQSVYQTEASSFTDKILEVSRVEDREFAICYKKLIAHYRQTPEESKRQLAGILRRISETDNPEKEKKE